jgi:hypothetical protein
MMRSEPITTDSVEAVLLIGVLLSMGRPLSMGRALADNGAAAAATLGVDGRRDRHG